MVFPLFRHRVHAIKVSAQCECASETMWRLRRGFIHTSSAASGFLVAFLHCTDTVFASARPETADETGICGTDKSVPYSYSFRCWQNRYILKQCSAYGADIITPHLPQAASSPQAPQGEDNWVHRKTQHRTNVARNVTVSTIVSNRATAITVSVSASIRL